MVHSIFVKRRHDAPSSVCKEENKNVNERNSSFIDAISVISINVESSTSENQKNDVSKGGETALQSICKIAIFATATVTLSLLSVVPWTTIPRTNSIVSPSSWMQILIPFVFPCIFTAGGDLLNLTIWTKERSLISIKTLSKMTFVNFASAALFYILSDTIWCVYLEYNHPLPYLGLVALVTSWIVLIITIWFVLPTNLTANEEFRKKLRIYTVYYLWVIALTVQNEVLSYLFTNLPANFQFLVAILIAACRELDKKIRRHLVTKMLGALDEPASALLEITSGLFYSSFVAVRIAGATGTTVFCVVSIDFALHSYIMHIPTYQRIQ